MRIKRSIWVVLFSGLSQLSDAACLSASQLNLLAQNEQTFLLNRIPPAFAHAVSDQQVKFNVTEASADSCTAVLALSVPAQHLDEANAVLDADPAKKIMLSAQGYVIPRTTNIEATFKVDPATLHIPAIETLQTSALGQLRASVEMLYSLITQSRANITDSTKNATPWSATYQQASVNRCTEKLVAQAGQEIATACACRVNQLSAQVSERQMAYIDYVRSNPYAVATGSSQHYVSLESQANSACGLIVK